MADRTSARIFGDIFDMLAENPTPEHKEMARKVYRMSCHYDFSPYQMNAHDSCKKLGVTRSGVCTEYPEDGIVTLWPDDKGYEQAGEDQ